MDGKDVLYVREFANHFFTGVRIILTSPEYANPAFMRRPAQQARFEAFKAWLEQKLGDPFVYVIRKQAGDPYDVIRNAPGTAEGLALKDAYLVSLGLPSFADGTPASTKEERNEIKRLRFAILMALVAVSKYSVDTAYDRFCELVMTRVGKAAIRELLKEGMDVRQTDRDLYDVDRYASVSVEHFIAAVSWLIENSRAE